MQCGYYSDIMNGQAREDFMAEETVTPVALRAPSVTVSCLFSGCRIHLRNLKNWFKKPGHLTLRTLSSGLKNPVHYNIRFLVSFPDAETKVYGEKLLESVKNLFKVIHEREEMTEHFFKKGLEEAKETIMKVATEDVPSSLDKNGKEEKREAQNMANRFRKHGKAYFEFITTPGIYSAQINAPLVLT